VVESTPKGLNIIKHGFQPVENTKSHNALAGFLQACPELAEGKDAKIMTKQKLH